MLFVPTDGDNHTGERTAAATTSATQMREDVSHETASARERARRLLRDLEEALRICGDTDEPSDNDLVLCVKDLRTRAELAWKADSAVGLDEMSIDTQDAEDTRRPTLLLGLPVEMLELVLCGLSARDGIAAMATCRELRDILVGNERYWKNAYALEYPGDAAFERDADDWFCDNCPPLDRSAARRKLLKMRRCVGDIRCRGSECMCSCVAKRLHFVRNASCLWEGGMPVGVVRWRDATTAVMGTWSGELDSDCRVTDGAGAIFWQNGVRYFGGIEDGRMDGHGTYRWPDGGYRVGGFKKGDFHGRGTGYQMDGRIVSAIWENDTIKRMLLRYSDRTLEHIGAPSQELWLMRGFGMAFRPSGFEPALHDQTRGIDQDTVLYDGRWENNNPPIGWGIALSTKRGLSVYDPDGATCHPRVWVSALGTTMISCREVGREWNGWAHWANGDFMAGSWDGDSGDLRRMTLRSVAYFLRADAASSPIRWKPFMFNPWEILRASDGLLSFLPARSAPAERQAFLAEMRADSETELLFRM